MAAPPPPNPPSPMAAFKLGLPPADTFSPGTTAQKKLEDIRERLIKTKQLTEAYNKRYNKLVDFNKQLTEGYIKNINVIIDIGTLLSMYNSVFDKVMEIIGQFDSQLQTDVKPDSIEHIKQLTTESLANVSKFFQNDVVKIASIMDKSGNGNMKVNLQTAVDRYKKVTTAADATVKEFATAAGGKHKKLKPVKVYQVTLKQLSNKKTNPKSKQNKLNGRKA